MLGPRRVETPSGVVWRVGRSWLERGWPRIFKRVVTGWDAGDVLRLQGPVWGFDVEGWMVALVALVFVIFVVVPLVLFGIELIVAGIVIAFGINAHMVFGRPWLVVAKPEEPGGRAIAWSVCGWRRSAKVIDDISGALKAGREPEPVAARALIET